MREQIITLMKYDNDQVDLSLVNQFFIDLILEKFDGCTYYDGMGRWRDLTGKVYIDQIIRVHVAIDDDDIPAFRALAAEYCRAAGQKSVYVIIDGEVYFIYQ